MFYSNYGMAVFRVVSEIVNVEKYRDLAVQGSINVIESGTIR